MQNCEQSFKNVHNKPGKLVLAQSQDFILNLSHNPTFILWLAMFEHVLNYVVSILIGDKVFAVLMKFLHYGSLLFGSAMFQDALDDPTAVRVSRERHHLM